MDYEVAYYPKFEERLNILTHFLGALLSVIALPFLIYKASHFGDEVVVLSVAIYGISMIILYTASTLYHSAKSKKIRFYLNIFDHASIYVLIAGTYTPIALVILKGTLGWGVFIFSWIFAISGILFKIFFIGKYKVISIVTYLGMGWMIVFAVNPLLENFSKEGLLLFVLGGVSYSIGALFFVFKRIPFNHAVFHVFVLLGSLCHFIGIYSYIL